jgi:hypothetical protein
VAVAEVEEGGEDVLPREVGDGTATETMMKGEMISPRGVLGGAGGVGGEEKRMRRMEMMGVVGVVVEG